MTFDNELVLSRVLGAYHAEINGEHIESDVSLERLLAKLAPGAPVEKLHAAAEIIDGVLLSQR